VPFRKVDTVVTPTDETEARDALGLIERQVLDRGAEELQKGRVLASSPTFTLYGAPCTLQTRSGHAQVRLLYGLLVDPTTGSLTTVVWAIPSESSSPLSPSALVLLAPRLVYTCGLDVAAVRLLGTVPINWTFAIRSLPPGRDVVIPKEDRDRFRRPQEIASDPKTFEQRLRSLLVQPRPVAAKTR
jgi:hypothetical protein